MSRPAVEFREPQPGDIEQLMPRLRAADLAECDALVGAANAQRAIEASLRNSVHAWTVEAGGEVAAVLGVTALNLMGGVGAPWMMGTPLVDRHRGALMRAAPSYIAAMLTAFPHLRNVVDARNTRSIAWLRRMGFQIHAPVAVGVAGLPFHPFSMDAPDVS